MAEPYILIDRIIPDILCDELMSLYQRKKQVRRRNPAGGGSYWVMGSQIADELPIPVEDLLLTCVAFIRQEFDAEVVPDPSEDRAIHLHGLEGAGSSFRYHFDRCDYSAVGFITTNPTDSALRLKTEDGPVDIHPRKGRLVLYNGRAIEHGVEPTSGGLRLSIPMAFHLV